MLIDHRKDNGFGKILALNESVKQLLDRSFQVSLLALDAMVQSKRGGGGLRGFDEVSSQMRMWSREMHDNLERLSTLSGAIVGEVSAAAKESRFLELFAEAARLSDNSDGKAVHQRLTQENADAARALTRDWRKVRELLSDLDQGGMMACVLSRSAMIEACSAGPDLREQLKLVSQAFYTNAQAVVDILKDVIKAVTSK